MVEAPVMRTHRAVCAICLRAQVACICAWIRPTATACEVLILQHPLEVRHAKNTARLLHLSLPGSRLVVGEVFDAATLQALMPPPRYTLLLYPPTDFVGHAPPAPLDAARLGRAAQASGSEGLRLVVLDATWRKSRKMLHQSPALQALPRMALHAVPQSRYAIRKAHAPGQLSTLEATCAALAQLDGNAAHWQPLLRAMDGFVAAYSELIFSSKDDETWLTPTCTHPQGW